MGVTDESVVDVFGKIACPKNEVASCTQKEVEIQVEKIFCISRAEKLPLVLADASRSEAELAKDPKLVRVGQDVRLDNRIIDLRTNANQAILRIQSSVCRFFRDFLLGHGFVEIHSPKMIASVSEGSGATVFKLDYFDTKAYLAQSPQLYKQMALMTGLGRVFEVAPVFRAEQSFTHRHMTEFMGLDLEMTFRDHYSEVLDMLDGLFNNIFVRLTKECAAEIEAVRAQYPFEDLKWKYPSTRFTFEEAIQLLKTKGAEVVKKNIAAEENLHEKKNLEHHLRHIETVTADEDLGTEDEKIIGKVIAADYGEEFYIINKFPKAVRPFYTMPDPDNSRWTNSYDLFLRGEEIVSGAQRIHDPQMLTQRCEEMGIDTAPLADYINAFRYGAFPHGGGGIGLERVVMLFLKLNNIRKASMFPRDPKRLTP